MNTTKAKTRVMGGAVAVGLTVAGLGLASPANAASVETAYGETANECVAVRDAKIDMARDAGQHVSDVTRCSHISGEHGWYASFSTS